MNPAVFDKPFFEVTLPLMLTIVSGVWAMISTNNRRLDDINHRFDEMNRRFDEVMQRLGRIETLLSEHDGRIARLEERTSPLARR